MCILKDKEQQRTRALLVLEALGESEVVLEYARDKSSDIGIFDASRRGFHTASVTFFLIFLVEVLVHVNW